MQVRGIAWSPDDLFLVTGSDDRTVNIWDTESLGLGASMTGHSDWVRSVAWSPAGDLVASSSDDGYVRLWNSSTATERKLSGHGDWVRAVTFSPDGRYVASAGDDRRVFVWSVDSDEAIAEMYVNGDWLYSIDWSPQGDTILVSGEPALGIASFSRLEPPMEIMFGGVFFSEERSRSRFKGGDAAHRPIRESLCRSGTELCGLRWQVWLFPSRRSLLCDNRSS